MVIVAYAGINQSLVCPIQNTKGQTMIKIENGSVRVLIEEIQTDRWVLELHNLDPDELVGWKVFKTEGEALDYADQCMME